MLSYLWVFLVPMILCKYGGKHALPSPHWWDTFGSRQSFTSWLSQQPSDAEILLGLFWQQIMTRATVYFHRKSHAYCVNNLFSYLSEGSLISEQWIAKDPLHNLQFEKKPVLVGFKKANHHRDSLIIKMNNKEGLWNGRKKESIMWKFGLVEPASSLSHHYVSPKNCPFWSDRWASFSLCKRPDGPKFLALAAYLRN